jgi:hypothetical protein
VNSLGYASIWWTVDTLGWKGNPDDGSTLDADALPTLITELRVQRLQLRHGRAVHVMPDRLRVGR